MDTQRRESYEEQIPTGVFLEHVRDHHGSLTADYVIVGSGLTGSTVARMLADAGREVLVLERRSHLGGNVHDQIHEPSGIRFHTYGPHLFRTSCKRIWEFATRFGNFWPYEHRILASIDGELVPWPPQRSYIERLAGKDWKPEFTGTPQNLEEAALSLMPRSVYSRMIEPYNQKMWNRPCRELSASLCKRFDVRDGDTRITPHARWQGLPRDGYTRWMQNMLQGIPTMTGFDYLKRREEVQARRTLVFTGAIDTFFDYRYGKLAYRSQRREHVYYPDKDKVLAAVQVNCPQHESGPHIRKIEWRGLMPSDAKVRGTLVTRETPFGPTDIDQFEYPHQDQQNARRYAEYQRLSQTLPNVVFLGRLAKYKYLDMDGAIGAAFVVARRLLAD